MEYSNLSDQEIKALLMQYDSEMRKLTFQVQVIQNTIQKLHEHLHNTVKQTSVKIFDTNPEPTVELHVPKVVSNVEYPKKREPKFILEEKKDEIIAPKKRGRKPGSVNSLEKIVVSKIKKKEPIAKVKSENLGKRKYTKDNPWPKFVTNQLSKYNHAMSSAQLYELAEEENQLKAYSLNKAEVRAMVSRAFFQLSNLKNSLAKFEIKGSKGYNYALKEWIDESGDLKPEFQP